MRLSISMLCFFAFGVFRAQAVGGESLSLPDCLSEALKNNPQVLEAQQDIAAAHGGIITAKAAVLPSISAQSQASLQNQDVFSQQNPPSPGFTSNWLVTLQLTKTVYNGGITRNQIAIAKLQEEISNSQLQRTINDVIFQTRKAFYDVLLNYSDINLRKQNIDLLKREVDRQKSLFEAGRSTKFDIIRTEVRLANEEPLFEQATAQYQLAVYNLLNEMGRPAPSLTGQVLDLEVKGDLEINPYPQDVNALVQEALMRSPELTMDEKQIEVEKRNINVAKATLIPQLSVFASTNQQRDTSQGGAFFNNSNQSTVGVLGTWNIFDGLNGKGTSMQAEARMHRDQIQHDAAVRQIEYDIRKSLLSLKQAAASLSTQQGNVEKAKQSIDLARSSVEAGLATQFDVLQATVDLSTAENIELQARYQYNVAMADLERVLYSRLDNHLDDEPVLANPAVGPKEN